MKEITIYRDDFSVSKDSEGTEYFDYILGDIGVPENMMERTTHIELIVGAFKAYSEDTVLTLFDEL